MMIKKEEKEKNITQQEEERGSKIGGERVS